MMAKSMCAATALQPLLKTGYLLEGFLQGLPGYHKVRMTHFDSPLVVQSCSPAVRRSESRHAAVPTARTKGCVDNRTISNKRRTLCAVHDLQPFSLSFAVAQPYYATTRSCGFALMDWTWRPYEEKHQLPVLCFVSAAS